MEVQQSVRGAMEILLRDLRMTGFDDDRTNTSEYPDKTVNPKIVTIPTPPIVIPVKDPSDDITVNYEYFDRNVNPGQQWHTVRFWRDAATSTLRRQLTVDSVARPFEIILENIDRLEFRYGVDQNGDGIMDDPNGNGQIDANEWLTAAQVAALVNPKVVAINVTLTGRPDQTNVDVSKVVSPRTLVSAVTLRNLSLR
jgi:Tfp pilus assembly protein PilW